MSNSKQTDYFTMNMMYQMFNSRTCFSPSNKNVIIIV